MAEHKERLARAMTREMGKVLAEARGDVQEGIDIAFLMAGEGRRMFGDTVPSELPDKWAMSIRQPIGVAGIITPWNFPMAIPCWKMMPALVAGNTVVFKPSSDTPHCATLLVELMAEAGFPAGTVNLVTGAGARGRRRDRRQPRRPRHLVHRLVGDRQGASPSGPAARLKRLSLELGGKNAIVVMADADLDLATDGILWSAFGTTGQRCTAASRVVVERAVVEPLLERLEARARKLRLGSGPRRGGRRRAADQRRRASRRSVGYVGIGRARGRAGHRRRAGAATATSRNGHFFAPTIFRGVAPMDRIAQEEIFGPVLSVIPVDDYAAAMTRVNQTRYGLSARRSSRRDANTAFRAMRDFETGHRLRQRRHDRRRDAPAVRRLEGDRQRPPRGGPRGARHVHRVEVDLRRLQRPPPARPDRQPGVGVAAERRDRPSRSGRSRSTTSRS